MTRSREAGALLLVALACLGLGASAALADDGGGPWVCPHCGDARGERVYNEPGTCPACGMKLVPRSRLEERMNVAILLFEGVQIIDYTGPYEVFGQGGIFEVYTVSETGSTLTTAMKMSVNPSYSFDNSPRPDILVVPGGNVRGPVDSARTIRWVRDVHESARYVMSVCNGAFILAKAGLLDGKSATTFYRLIDGLREAAPKTKVVTDQRWVDNGKVITTAGLSSGIDGALHLISKIRGMARAKAVALHMEYDWDPHSDFARAALADMRFPDIEPPADAELDLLSTGGNRETWTRRYEVRSSLASSELADYLESRMGQKKGWKPLASDPDGEGSDLERSWIAVDEDGAAWTFTAGVEGAGTAEEPSIITFHIEKTHRSGTAAR